MNSYKLPHDSLASIQDIVILSLVSVKTKASRGIHNGSGNHTKKADGFPCWKTIQMIQPYFCEWNYTCVIKTDPLRYTASV
jgi:hypothetical protein